MSTKNIVRIQPHLAKETNYETCSKLFESPFLLQIKSFEEDDSVVTEDFLDTLSDQFNRQFSREKYIAVESVLSNLIS